MSDLTIAPSVIMANCFLQLLLWERQRMAQIKSRNYPPIECGDIYFLYRPAVG